MPQQISITNKNGKQYIEITTSTRKKSSSSTPKNPTRPLSSRNTQSHYVVDEMSPPPINSRRKDKERREPIKLTSRSRSKSFAQDDDNLSNIANFGDDDEFLSDVATAGESDGEEDLQEFDRHQAKIQEQMDRAKRHIKRQNTKSGVSTEKPYIPPTKSRHYTESTSAMLDGSNNRDNKEPRDRRENKKYRDRRPDEFKKTTPERRRDTYRSRESTPKESIPPQKLYSEDIPNSFEFAEPLTTPIKRPIIARNDLSYKHTLPVYTKEQLRRMQKDEEGLTTPSLDLPRTQSSSSINGIISSNSRQGSVSYPHNLSDHYSPEDINNIRSSEIERRKDKPQTPSEIPSKKVATTDADKHRHQKKYEPIFNEVDRNAKKKSVKWAVDYQAKVEDAKEDEE